MSIPRIRAGSSGKNVQPSAGKGNPSWSAAAPLVVTILPAGHPPGLYDVEVSAFNNTVATGTWTSALSWGQLGAAAATLVFGSVNLNTLGLTFTVDRAIQSDGSLPIVWTATPVGVSGSPSVNVIAAAQLLATPVGT